MPAAKAKTNFKDNLQVSDQRALRSYIDRVENLNEQRAGLAGDIADLMEEAKNSGFDPAIIKKVIAARKKGKTEFLEQEALFQVYLNAISWIDTPLGNHADQTDGPRLVVV